MIPLALNQVIRCQWQNLDDDGEAKSIGYTYPSFLYRNQ